MKKYGFSLSEVMVTLVVIGVIAMLVVPNVIDSSTSKLNITAANKAKMDVHQAAMRLQAECPRWHGCTTAQLLAKFKSYLPDNGDTTYYFKNDTSGVAVDVDGGGTPDLAYTLSSDGTVEENSDCSVTKYKAGTACVSTKIDTNFSTNYTKR